MTAKINRVGARGTAFHRNGTPRQRSRGVEMTIVYSMLYHLRHSTAAVIPFFLCKMHTHDDKNIMMSEQIFCLCLLTPHENVNLFR